MTRGKLNVALGKSIRQRWQAMGSSQEELTAKCGVHRTYLGAIERGERNGTLETLEGLAAALGVDPLELLSESRRGKSASGLWKRKEKHAGQEA